MIINEIFYSIQGEGPWVGIPSVFVRISGCHLRCRWCDTPMSSWKPEGANLSVEQILEKLGAWPGAPVVITGGEPLLFPEVKTLIEGLKSEGRLITIETSGSVFLDVQVDLMSISPKLKNSNPEGAPRESHESKRLQLEVIQKLRTINKKTILKFVVEDTTDLPEIEGILSALNWQKAHRVILMPQAVSKQEVEKKSLELAHICMQKGWRLGDRLQVRLWGNTPGT